MIILTGGAGFIGSCFLKKLNDEGKTYTDYVQKDDFLRMVKAGTVKRPAHIVHMGACSSTTLTDSDYYIKNNYEYSKILAKWAFESRVPFLYASSAATYGAGENGYSDDNQNTYKLKPLNMYGYSKQMFDLWVLEGGYENKATGIKFFNVYGPNEYHKGDMMSVICKKYINLKEKGGITLFKSYRKDIEHGDQKRDFIYVKDATEMMYFLFKNPDKTGIFNMGTGVAHSWNEVAKAMFSAAGKSLRIQYIDMPETLKEKYQYYTCAEMSKLRLAGCTHECMPLETAVKDYVSYLEAELRC